MGCVKFYRHADRAARDIPCDKISSGILRDSRFPLIPSVSLLDPFWCSSGGLAVPENGAIAGFPCTGAISSVGRASRLHGECRRVACSSGESRARCPLLLDHKEHKHN